MLRTTNSEPASALATVNQWISILRFLPFLWKSALAPVHRALLTHFWFGANQIILLKQTPKIFNTPLFILLTGTQPESVYLNCVVSTGGL